MKLRVQRIDPGLPMPASQTPGAAAVDFHAREETIVPPRATVRIPTGVRVEVPAGHVLVLAARSSTPIALGLHIPHGIGIIDPDYREELLFQYYNPGDTPVTIPRGQRIGQGMLLAVAGVEVEEVDELSPTTRTGGFGSTGQF